MHSDMNTKDKWGAFKEVEEELITTVGGNIPAQKPLLKLVSGGPKLWSVTDDATAGMNESNFYLCLTEENLHFCILNSYNPELVRKRVTIPRSEAELEVVSEGAFHNKIRLKTENEEVMLIIPKTRGITRLKDQAECAGVFMDAIRAND